jgi:hypothetical protein
MTVKEIISYIRGTIKEHDDDLGPYTDKYLWETFNIAKADVLSNFRLRRFNYQNPQNYIGFCMELEKGLSHECNCITYGCEVLVTKKELPKYFSGRNTASLRVYTLGNKQIDIVTENEVQDVLSYDKMYKDKIVASIINNRLVIWNTLELKVIRVVALWEDITEINSVQYCNNNDPTQPNCIDVYNTSIGVDKDLIYTIVRERVMALLDPTFKLQEDMNNDSNPEIRV